MRLIGLVRALAQSTFHISQWFEVRWGNVLPDNLHEFFCAKAPNGFFIIG
jgi:hypothetical protein